MIQEQAHELWFYIFLDTIRSFLEMDFISDSSASSIEFVLILNENEQWSGYNSSENLPKHCELEKKMRQNP